MMKKLNELIQAHESQVRLNLDDFQLSVMLDDIGEAALIGNENDPQQLVLVLRGIKTKLTENERRIFGDVAEGYPVYILRSLNGDDYFSLSEFFGDQESQPFASGSEAIIFDIIAGL
jgi:hypothetical protein